MFAFDVPVDVGRDDARDAAAKELSDPAYGAARPSFLSRLLSWANDRLDDLFGGVAGVDGVTALVALAVLVLVLVVLVRARVGPLGRAARRARTVFDESPRTAEEHRRAAERALSQGKLDEAVRERFRAVVRDLEQRGVLDERAGRTVDEVAVEAGRQLPGCAADLRAGARLFDDVWYGGLAATEDGYRLLVALDERVRSERVSL